MSRAVLVAKGFNPTPSIAEMAAIKTQAVLTAPANATVIAIPVSMSGEPNAELKLGRDALAAAGFTGAMGQTLVIPGDDRVVIAVGIGEESQLTTASIRDAASSFALAAYNHANVVVSLEGLSRIPMDQAAQALVEGIVLARYGYDPLKREPGRTPLSSITMVAAADHNAAAASGAARGMILASATALARDLANTPPAHLNATDIADIAVKMAKVWNLEVEVFDRDALVKMGCGGLIGVNGGSSEEPRMIKLKYKSGKPNAPKLTLVGKGVMYDSGGISLKPSDAVHATMKTDMSGAGNILAAMSALSALECPTDVTSYLMCTDNMPSGTALKLGDVMTIRGGTTVEVINTDAEGRLMLADGLVLATEEPTDAIIDMATLTGACMMALGTMIGGVLGNNQPLIDQLIASANTTDEPLWQLPLSPLYRRDISSEIADIKNMGGKTAGAITAALFLNEFVGNTPWAHIDIAGTAQNDVPELWRTKGASGFGTRMILDAAINFKAPRA